MQLAMLETPEARHDDWMWRTQAITSSVSGSLAIQLIGMIVVEEEVVDVSTCLCISSFMTTEAVNPARLTYFAEGILQDRV